MARRLLAPGHPPVITRKLRLRITRELSGSIDGIQLERFRAGFVYAVGTSLGSYLLAIGAAEPVPDDEASLTLAPEQQLFGPVVLGRNYRPVPLAQAADREPRKRQATPAAKAAKRIVPKQRR